MKYQNVPWILLFVPLMVLSMDRKQVQLEVCPTRKTYIQNQKTQDPTLCSFCDKEILATTYILEENTNKDTRIMLNKHPYVPFDRGFQILIMPISHKEKPTDFSSEELNRLTDEAQRITIHFHDDSYTQEYFTNWGKCSGGSVAHWHNQMKIYIQKPSPLPDLLRNSIENNLSTNIESAFALAQSKLSRNIHQNNQPNKNRDSHNDDCLCCIVNNANDDKNNLIVTRFKHNYICLSHYPALPGEVCVVPKRHVSTIKDLSQEELRENMALATVLLSKIQEYAQCNIRDCDGGNLFCKSLGGKASEDEHSHHHVFTVVMPRTTVPLTPGFMQDNSVKLDYDPLDLLAYLRNIYSPQEK